MGKLRIQHKLLLLCAGLIFTCTMLSMLVIHYSVVQRVEEQVESALQRSLQSFKRLKFNRMRRLSNLGSALSENARLHETIIRTDYPTWVDELISIQGGFEEFPDPARWELVFLLTDAEGMTRVRSDRTEKPVNDDKSKEPIIKDVLDNGWPREGYGVLDSDVYELSVYPWLKGTELDGTFVIGSRVNDDLARQIGETSETEVTFLMGDRVVASTLSKDKQNEVAVQAITVADRIASLPAPPRPPQDASDDQIIEFFQNELNSTPRQGKDYVEDRVTLQGHRYFAVYMPVRNGDKPFMTLVLHMDEERQLGYLRSMEITLAAVGLGVIVLGILVSGLLSRRFTRPILDLARVANELGAGNYDVKVPFRAEDEIGELAHTFEHMRDRIVDHLARLKETERMQRDLELAHNIQQSLLPERPPNLPRLQVACVCRTTNRVGGDYFDFLTFDEAPTRLDLVIADVFGHDVGAALMMATGRTALRAAATAERTPPEVVSQANHTLFDDLARAELLISLAYVRIEASTKQMDYANAGHNPPFIFRDGAVHRLDRRGPVLGLMPTAEYPGTGMELSEGDILVMYTDGITEAENSAEEPFGTARLEAAVRNRRNESAEAILNGIVKDVEEFTGRLEFDDDLTLVVVRVS